MPADFKIVANESVTPVSRTRAARGSGYDKNFGEDSRNNAERFSFLVRGQPETEDRPDRTEPQDYITLSREALERVVAPTPRPEPVHPVIIDVEFDDANLPTAHAAPVPTAPKRPSRAERLAQMQTCEVLIRQINGTSPTEDRVAFLAAESRLLAHLEQVPDVASIVAYRIDPELLRDRHAARLDDYLADKMDLGAYRKTIEIRCRALSQQRTRGRQPG